MYLFADSIFRTGLFFFNFEFSEFLDLFKTSELGGSTFSDVEIVDYYVGIEAIYGGELYGHFVPSLFL